MGCVIYICKKNNLSLSEIYEFFENYIKNNEEKTEYKYLSVFVTDFDVQYKQALSRIPKIKRPLFTKEIFSLRFEEDINELSELLWFTVYDLLPNTQKYIESNYTVIKKIHI